MFCIAWLCNPSWFSWFLKNAYKITECPSKYAGKVHKISGVSPQNKQSNPCGVRIYGHKIKVLAQTFKKTQNRHGSGFKFTHHQQLLDILIS